MQSGSQPVCPAIEKTQRRIRHNDAMYTFRSALLFFASLQLACLAPLVHAAELPAAFTSALKQAGIPLDHVAVLVQPLGAPEPVLSLNAEALICRFT
ncbi:MAG TPA: hypothetical protein VIN38_12790 [Thiobacillus sp.]